MRIVMVFHVALTWWSDIETQTKSSVVIITGAVRVSTFGSVSVRVSAPLVGNFSQGLSRYAESMAVDEIPSQIAGAG
jgi:hypothetical protein